METTQSKEQFLDKILKAAKESPEFRAKLVADPKAVIEAQLHFKFPESFEISVHENTANTLHILLPDVVEELSELELSAVSGGVCWDNCDSYYP